MSPPESVREGPSSRFSGWTRQRIVFLSISAAFSLAVLVFAREALLPFALALIIAYVLTPLVALCERGRVPRPAAILLVYAATFTLLYLTVATIAPRVYVEAQKVAGDAPNLARELSTKWGPRLESWVQGVVDRAHVGQSARSAAAANETVGQSAQSAAVANGSGERSPPPPAASAIEIVTRPDGTLQVDLGAGLDVVQQGPGHWRVGPANPRPPAKFNVAELTEKGVEEAVNYAKRNAFGLIKLGHTVIRKVSRAIFLLFMTLMVAGYLMHTRESILAFFRSLVPPRSRMGFDHLLWRIDRGLSGVVRGQLVICLLNGMLSAFGFWMFDLKYWPILAIVAAVMSIVPIFGSIMSSVPVVIVGLTQGFWTALWVLLWIIGIHQIEANLLNPKIIGVAAKIHPVLVVLALIIGEHFFGLWGALLAVPTLSCAQSVFNHFRFESMPDAPPDSLVNARETGARIPTPR